VRLRVLASGSSGNAALLTLHEGGRRHDLLIDLGLSPRRLRGLLQAEGADLEGLTAVLLTHGDVDHLHPGWSRSWPSLLAPPIVLRPGHASIPARAGLVHASTRWVADELTIGPFRIRGMELPHDTEGSTAFRVDAGQTSVGWATDLGTIPEGLHAFMLGVRLLGLESNYDPPMQQASPRPEHLKQRITGGRGHLSNDQAIAFVRGLHEADAMPEGVVLLHLSEQCNHPDVVHHAWMRLAPDLAAHVRIAQRRIPTDPLSAAPDGVTSAIT
jgi:phosphoribosyl 1,2-cyclic phosphodiesterase